MNIEHNLAPQYHSFYRYDANGERTYKLAYRHKNSRPQYVFHGATMYPSPFLVITPTGYTKHYYAGTERIAAQIGKGRFNNVNTSIANTDSTTAKLTAVNGIATYLANYASQKFAYLNTLPIISSTQKEIYYYHTDHLGSSAWITDSLGVAVQHLAYLPWGEPYVTQKTGNFNPTYTFSGKERDEETGYSYFGQRFYDSQLSIWLSADPMRGKYPSLSPFVYCGNNPILLVDPNGEDVQVSVSKDKKTGRTFVTFYVTMRIENHSYATSDVIVERAAGIKLQIEDSFKGYDKKTNTQYETIVQFVNSNDKSEKLVLDFVNDIRGRSNPSSTGKTDEFGNVKENTIQVEIDGCIRYNGQYNQTIEETSRTGGHEFGHVVGLRHKKDPQNKLSIGSDNLMNQSVDSNSTKITIEQLEYMRQNINN